MAFPTANPAPIKDLWAALRETAAREGLAPLAGTRLPQAVLGLPAALSLMAPLSPEVVAQVAAGRAPTMLYYQHYRTVNALLDRATFLLARILSEGGYRALPIPASQTVDRAAQAGAFPHKTAAVLAGLGWIGRHALLVTEHYGPRIRLATVLTDLPCPEPSVQASSRCGDCRVCQEACPAGAIQGAVWAPGLERSSLVDAHACLDYMQTHFDKTGRGSVCGVCMAVCPGGSAEG